MTTSKTEEIDDVSKDIVKYLPFKFFPGLAGLATIFFLTKTFAPDNYGLYSYVISSNLIFLQLANSWLVNAVLFVFPEYDPQDQRQIEKLTSIMQLIVSTFFGVILFLLVFSFTKSFYLSAISFLLLLTQCFLNLNNGFLQSKRLILLQLKVSIFQSMSQILLIFLFIYVLKYGVEVALALMLLSYIIAILVLKINKDRNISYLSPIKELELAKKILRFGLPMGLWFFFYQLIISGDRIILKYYGLTAILGQYASFKDLLTGVSGFLTMPILLASHPIIMGKWKKKETNFKLDIESIIEKNMSVILLLFVPIILLLSISGTELLVLFLDKRYLLSNSNMMFISMSILLSSVNLYIQKGLEITGQTIKLALIGFCLSLLGMILNFFLVPVFHLQAVVLVSVAVQVLYSVIIYHYSKSIIQFSLSKKTLFRLFVWMVIIVSTHFALKNIRFFNDNTALIFELIIFFTSLFYLYYKSQEFNVFLGVLQSFRKGRK